MILEIVILILYHLELAKCLSLTSCSTTNLGSDETSYHYMSNGYCQTYCQPLGYSVAILQSYSCWCSNYLPEDTTSMSNCEESCPGYGSENCAQDGYYGYLVIGQVSGTVGSSASLTSSTSSSTSETSTSTTSASSADAEITSSAESQAETETGQSSSQPTPPTSTAAASSSSSTSTTSSSSSSTSSSSTTSSSTSSSSTSSSSTSSTASSSSTKNNPPSRDIPSSTATDSTTTDSETSLTLTSSPDSASSSSMMLLAEATTVTSVKTVNGTAGTTLVIETDYITLASTSASVATLTSGASSDDAAGAALSKSHNNSFIHSKGKLAGTFTVVGLVVVALIAGLVYFCCRSRRNANGGYVDDEGQYSSDDYSANNEKVAGGVASSSVTSINAADSLKRYNSSNTLKTLFTASPNGGVARSSSRKKLNPHNRTKLGNSNEAGAGQLMFPITELDSRLDPNTMFLNDNESKSLKDDEDYSRKILTVANPE